MGLNISRQKTGGGATKIPLGWKHVTESASAISEGSITVCGSHCCVHDRFFQIPPDFSTFSLFRGLAPFQHCDIYPNVKPLPSCFHDGESPRPLCILFDVSSGISVHGVTVDIDWTLTWAQIPTSGPYRSRRSDSRKAQEMLSNSNVLETCA